MADELGAMMNGMAQGKNAYAGLVPSAANVGGAPAAFDAAAPLFKQGFTVLAQLSNFLYKMNAQEDADSVAELTIKLNRIAQTRLKKKAESHVAQEMSPVAKVGNLGAMGIPRGA